MSPIIFFMVVCSAIGSIEAMLCLHVNPNVSSDVKCFLQGYSHVCGNHDAAEDAAIIYTFMGCCKLAQVYVR